MSYLVLARKYRPQTFEEIVGQEHVTRTLANAFAKGRVHHAFLFCGARGVGKTTAARILAKALCCEKGPSATPCGVCDACVTITGGTAVDYFEIDGASNNGVDDIRELRDGVRYQPAQLRRKIYVIDEVHMLSVAAFNALLKTLEEPPPHVTFIFATTEVHKIPITILSRTQRYDFKLVPTQRLLVHLEGILRQEGLAVDAGALALLAREAGGSVRDALSLMDQVVAYAGGEPISEAMVADVLGVADRALLGTLLGAVLGHDPRTALTALESALGRGVDLSHLARAFLLTLRDAAVIQSTAQAEGLIDATADEIEALRALVKDVPRTHVVYLFDRFAKACEELAKALAPRLLIEVALVDMASAEPLAPISALVDRLDQLEGRMRSGAPSPSPSRSAPASVPRPTPAPPAAAAVAPPPAPAPASAPAPRAPGDPVAAWARVVEKMPPVLGGIYDHVRIRSWSEKQIELAAAPGSTPTHAEHVASLKKFLAQQGITAEVKLVEDAVVSEQKKQEKDSAREKREQEARLHPITEAVIQTFGASIKEIKVDG